MQAAKATYVSPSDTTFAPNTDPIVQPEPVQPVFEKKSSFDKLETSFDSAKKMGFSSNNSELTPQERKNRCIGFSVLGFVVLCVAIGLIAASLKKVETTEYGLEYDIHAKELDDAAKSGGLFLGPPGFEFIKFPSTFITVDLNDRICVSNDGLLVTFEVTFQYQMTEANMVPAIQKYRDFPKWASIVEQAGLSAVHHSCSDFQVTEFQSKRGIIQDKMFENLKLKLEGDPDRNLEGVNAVAVSLQLRFVGLPEAYNDAVAEKQSAQEEIAVAVAQRRQETTKANTELLRAKQEAQRILDAARNEAEVLLTEANLRAEETLFAFEKEADALMQVKQSLGYDSEGVLAYLSNMLVAEAQDLEVTTEEPARLGRKNFL